MPTPYARDSNTRRARQNVIFELGYFLAALGRSRVCPVVRGEVELPSDYLGVLTKTFDDSGRWKTELVNEINLALNRAHPSAIS